MTPELEALAVRVEALTGPDREVDCEIAWHTKWRWPDWEEGDLCIEDRGLEYVKERVEIGHNSIWRNVPRYTASVDAALTLALPSWWFSASLPLSPDAYGYSREDLRKPRAAFEMLEAPYIAAARAETLPLAIVAACLRGRARTSTQNHKGTKDA